MPEAGNLKNELKTAGNGFFLPDGVILKVSLFLFFWLMSFAAIATASNAEAWQRHRQEVIRSCVQASQLSDAAPVGSAIEFNDDAGYTALLLEGRYRKKNDNKSGGLELCLFDKRTKKAYISDATGLAPESPPQRHKTRMRSL